MVTLIVSGCEHGSRKPLDVSSETALIPLMPQSVRIVKPFTVWTDFDGEPGMDGVNVYLQPLNAAGDPVQAAGSIYVEMYTFQATSMEPKGDRLGIWDFPLRTQSDQDARWRRSVQMYELPVSWPEADRPEDLAAKYVLTVTHNSPLGDRHFDEMIIETPPVPGRFSRNE